MVLRRPYAFLIKHFRLIHLIITFIFGYIVYKNSKIYAFLNTVIDNSTNRVDAYKYINYGTILLGLLALGLCLIVYWLLKYKDKPKRLYMVTIVGYLVVGIFTMALFGYMGNFNNTVIDQKTIRLYRDIMTMTLIFQYIIIAFMFVRGLGFDIKKFNFSKDFHDLGYDETDSEEVEVNTQIDATNVTRMARKHAREFGYYFKEYKIYILSILAIVAIIVGYNLYGVFSRKMKIYHENDTLGVINKVSVVDSYYSTSSDGNYVIVTLNISKSGKRALFNLGTLTLNVGSKKYTPNKNICYKFSNLGNCYKQQYISNNSQKYIFVFDVNKVSKNSTYLTYNESYDTRYKVKLNLKKA